MALSITHPFHSPIVDENNPGEVGPDEWNAEHSISGTLDAGDVSGAGALTKADDTNVTLTLGGTPTGALLKATSITVGWTGTLAAGRLNSNVVQAVTNDTNVTGSISAQALTLGWTGVLAVSRGGTGISSFGTGVAAALGVNVGSAGSVVVNGGALGTPSSGTLSSCTGLPVSTGISGFGTGVATALAVNTGSAGAFVIFNGALGTPSSGTLSSCTGLPISTGVSGLGTGVATFLATPSSANLRAALTDEVGTGAAYFVGGALGTPASGTLSSCSGLPISTGVSGLGTNVATFLGTPSSANLRGALTDETGAGSAVFADTPTLIAPVLGTPTSGNLSNCTSYPAASDTLSGIIEIAIQSEMETATDTTRAVVPGRQHFHPGSAKAWACVGVTGNILASYNVSSVTDLAAGRLQVDWNTDFSTANYSAVAMTVDNASADNSTSMFAQTAGSFSAWHWRNTGEADPGTWNVVAFGDH